MWPLSLLRDMQSVDAARLICQVGPARSPMRQRSWRYEGQAATAAGFRSGDLDAGEDRRLAWAPKLADDLGGCQPGLAPLSASTKPAAGVARGIAAAAAATTARAEPAGADAVARYSYAAVRLATDATRSHRMKKRAARLWLIEVRDSWGEKELVATVVEWDRRRAPRCNRPDPAYGAGISRAAKTKRQVT